METKTAVVLLTASGVTITILAAKLAVRNSQLKIVMNSAVKLQNWARLASQVIAAQAERNDGLWVPEQLAFDIEAFQLLIDNEM